MILALPGFERHASALKISSVISILFHGALLGALAWTFPHIAEKQVEKSVTIELAQLDSLPLEKPQPPAPPEPPAPVAEPEPPREVAPPPEPAPVKAPKPAPKKQTPPKQAQARPAPAKSQTVAQALPPANNPRSAPSTASAQPTAPVKDAANPKPVYPELARKRGQEGIARVRCQVDSSGKVTAVALAQSSGHKLLDDAALKTAAKWRFKPGMSQGAPVAASVIVPVEFRLK